MVNNELVRNITFCFQKKGRKLAGKGFVSPRINLD